MLETKNLINEFFEPGGMLSQKNPAYEHRPGQIMMAHDIRGAFIERKHYIAEAGTGTGKTLAYLIPAIEAAMKYGKRIIVSTGTKNLQEQLIKKDIPFLQKLIPGFKAVCMKGRYNYACLYKIEKGTNEPILTSPEEAVIFNRIEKWVANSATGDKAEIENLPEDLPLWQHINATTDNCLGRNCDYFKECFITRLRAEAEEAHVIVVNHHLFFADLALRGNYHTRAIPDYDFVVFDEAHLIEEIATDHFGYKVSNSQFKKLFKSIGTLSIDNIKNFTKQAGEKLDILWKYFELLVDNKNLLVVKNGFSSEILDAHLALSSILKQTTDYLAKFPSKENDGLRMKLTLAHFHLDFLLTQVNKQYVYFFSKKFKRITLEAAPVEVADFLRSKLFENIDSCILTSATLCINNTFTFICERLGLDVPTTFSAPAVFDYQKQALMYLPEMDDPKGLNYQAQAIKECVDLLKISKGRAFVLTTSNKAMKMLYEKVAPQLDFPCMMQGELSKTELLDQFRRKKNPVLFATTSFWEGIDVQGDQLSMVIIDKLPFAVPDDPITEARHDRITEYGGNSFSQYTLPDAVIALKQGFGRLIRSKTDCGVVAILDSRLRTKQYGNYFLNSLPNARITSQISDVKEFMK